METSIKKKRIWEIDFIRGFSIFFMVIDHLLYNFYSYPKPHNFNWNIKEGDLVYFLNKIAIFEWEYLREVTFLRIELHYYFVAAFILISGISTCFSKSSLRRSLIVLLGAYAVSIVTNIFSGFFNPRFEIAFGILHTIGFSMLIYSLKNLITKNKYVDLVIGLSVIAYFYLIPQLGIGNIYINKIDVFSKEFYLAIVGLGQLPSVDFFGMVPWFGFFMIGAYLGKSVYKDRRSLLPKLDGKWNTPFIFLGKYSIWIYLTHQIILFALFALIGLLLGYPLPF